MTNFIQNLIDATARGAQLPLTLSKPISVAGLNIARLDLMTIGGTIVLILILALFLNRTRFGLQMRAAARQGNGMPQGRV